MAPKAEAVLTECQGCRKQKEVCTWCLAFGITDRSRLCRRCHVTALGEGAHQFTTDKQEVD